MTNIDEAGPGPALPTPYTLSAATADLLLDLAVADLDGYWDVEFYYGLTSAALREELAQLFPAFTDADLDSTVFWLLPTLINEVIDPGLTKRDLGTCDECETSPAVTEYKDGFGEPCLALCAKCV